MVVSTAIELIERTKKERQNIKTAYKNVEKHLNEIENGQDPMINGFKLDLKELIKSAQELLKKT